MNKTFGNITIVVGFAVLHFIVALVSRLLNYYDDIPLTILTIAMVVVVAVRNNTRTEVVAILTLIATLLGFIIGSWLWEPIAAIAENDIIAPAISTFLITSVLGISIHYITESSRRLKNDKPSWRPSARKIVVAAMAILILRIAYTLMFRAEIFSEGSLLESIIDIMENTWALLILIVSNIVLSINLQLPRESHTKKGRRAIWRVCIISLLIIICSSAIIYYDIPHFDNPARSSADFALILSASTIVDILIATILFLVQLSTTSNRSLKQERELKHRTEYQYERLKQQINPHFLFNSLGILDYLVQEHETERASAFIRKLAGIYRYMLNNDTKPLVKLSDELDFTEQYIDLLKERFTAGMVVDIDIEREKMERMVVPCALQLLVENATKHNIVAEDMPLRISISTESNMLVVRNNLQPRTHGQPSTRLGLSNIQQQYIDITRRNIIIQKTENEFIVKLPIV